MIKALRTMCPNIVFKRRRGCRILVAAVSSFLYSQTRQSGIKSPLPGARTHVTSKISCSTLLTGALRKKERFRAPFYCDFFNSLEEISVPVYPVPCVCVTVVAGVIRICRINAVICSRLRYMSKRPCQICSYIYRRPRFNIRICPPCITDTHTYAAM